MSVLKTLVHSRQMRQAVPWLIAGYIRLIWATGRWEVRGAEIPADFWDNGRPFILAFWHGRLLMVPCLWRSGVPINILISQHRDGELISRSIRHFGMMAVRGSSRRGGSGALRTMVRGLRAGTAAGFTPDGPRGPRMRASDGVATAARLAGVPIVPLTFGARRCRILGSWDRFVLPLPFTRGIALWGTPIVMPQPSDAAAQAATRQAVEAALNALTAEADRLCGHVPVEPAPVLDHAGT